MKKITIIIMIVFLAVILSGCAQTTTEARPQQISRFVRVEQADVYNVVYDKETKVMYAVSYNGSGSGVFTLLVNADGTPKLWEE